MEEKIILAVLDEMKIHSVRFMMEDLTRRLHISKSSLYKYFSSKGLLIHAIINFFMNEFHKEADEVREENFSAEEKVRKFIRAYTKVFRYFEHGIYNDLQNSYPKEWKRWEDFRKQKIKKLLTFMQDGIDAGNFRPINLKIFQFCLLSMSERLTDNNFLNENDLTFSRAVEDFSEILLNGFLIKK